MDRHSPPPAMAQGPRHNLASLGVPASSSPLHNIVQSNLAQHGYVNHPLPPAISETSPAANAPALPFWGHIPPASFLSHGFPPPLPPVSPNTFSELQSRLSTLPPHNTALPFPFLPPQSSSAPVETLSGSLDHPAARNLTARQRLVEMTTDKEEGELSDEDGTGTATEGQADQSIPRSVATTHAGSPERASLRGAVSQNLNDTRDYIGSSHIDAAQKPGEQTIAQVKAPHLIDTTRDTRAGVRRTAAARDPPSDATKDNRLTARNTMTPHLPGLAYFTQDHHQTDYGGPPPANRDIQNLQDKATDFVRFLRRRGYDTATLAREGLDLALLEEIFGETNLNKPVAPTTGASVPNSTGASVPQPAEITQVPAFGSAPITKPSDGPRIQYANTEQPLKVGSALLATKSLPSTPGLAPSTRDSVESRSSSGQNSRVEAAPGGTQTGAQPPTVAKKPDPPMDRQAYIARLMAAKSRKSTTSSSVEAPKVAQISHATNLHTTSSPKDLQTDQTAKARAVLRHSLEGEAEALQKKKAQTELARRRIEALELQRKLASQKTAQHQAKQSSIKTASEPSSEADFAVATSHQHATGRPTFKETEGDRPTANASGLLSPIPGLSMAGRTYSDPVTSHGKSIRLQTGKPNDSMSDEHGKRSRSPAGQATLYEQILPAKRVFGLPRNHHHHDTIVIEASDDDSDASSMDIDTASNTKSPFAPTIHGHPTPGSKFYRRGSGQPGALLQPFARTPAQQPSSAATPNAVNTPGSIGDLNDKILALKQQIAEKQQRKVKAQGSSAPSPGSSHLQRRPLKGQGSSEQHENDASSRSDSMSIQWLDKNIPHGLLSPTGGSVSNSRSEVDTRQARGFPRTSRQWKQQRRAEIRVGLPTIDSSVADNTARRERLKRELEMLESEHQNQMRQRLSLTMELDELGVETEGVTDDESQAQQISAQIGGTHVIDLASGESPESSVDQFRVCATEDHQDPAASPTQGLSRSQFEHVTPPDIIAAASESRSEQAEEVRWPIELDEDSGSMELASPAISSAQEIVSSPSLALDSTRGHSPAADVSPSKEAEQDAVGTALPEPEVQGRGEEETVSVLSQGEDSSRHMVGGVESLDQEVSPPPAPDVQTANEVNPATLVEPQVDVADDSSPATAPGASESLGLSSSPDSVIVAETDVNGEETYADSQTDDRDKTLPAVGEAGSESDISDHMSDMSLEVSSDSEDDAVLEILPDAAPILIETSYDQSSAEANAQQPQNPASKTGSFMPYESPLHAFKQYRYHPQYLSQVRGGYRSLTYSHSIDPVTPLCQVEAEGGTCNDKSCQKQHFRDMALTDDKILVQLGMKNPGQTKEENARWTEGLKEVLRDLRQRNIKDPEIVADEIVKYRQAFLHDPSRIVSI